MASALSIPQDCAGVSVELIARGLDLVPIPAMQVGRNGDGLFAIAVNRAYRLAGLGAPSLSPSTLTALSTRIVAFLDSSDTVGQFAWQMGQAIDCRHYLVTLARSTAAVRDVCQVHFIDHTAQHRTERSLRREMTADSLTGLPNREGFGDAIEQSLRAGERVAVLVVDLNRFGRLNACLGGLAGDELLITVARRIRGSLRAHDTLARIGGDEFGILLAIDDGDEAYHAAKRIERVLTEPFRLSDYEIGVEGSIGIAFSDAENCVDDLVRHAQFAIKRAKETGRPEVYQNHELAIERQRFGMETALRRAVENGELRLSYQPICDLATGRIVSVEALARWRTGAGEEIEPTRFIPVAEESGLIVPLGRWAIAEATQTLAAWDARAGGDCGISVAVNLSPIQLQRDTLTGVVERALAAAGLAGERLKLELTESALVTDPERTAATMHSLKELGTTIAMDDFGTGYSNLAFLQKLPIDLLKIDRSFVTGMLADRDKMAIVRAILSLADALGMRTVAEGVETPALVTTLAAMGCSMGQGFHYARPLAADAAWTMITASGR
ncbi:putative bifunctional diguanylate cyclase/phosphodiesterase [Sphingomonas bacterium]|uniref:putative bifunctional diguanylate cyclase/phosphodiesterase n=1 Tax=Sphingomonas bacterium TaxID=1895847 RepID=UPI0015766665|nr:bifunctional diguanylate cyclase/phosphodiesterase [Sphingomonas bacterium]